MIDRCDDAVTGVSACTNSRDFEIQIFLPNNIADNADIQRRRVSALYIFMTNRARTQSFGYFVVSTTVCSVLFDISMYMFSSAARLRYFLPCYFSLVASRVVAADSALTVEESLRASASLVAFVAELVVVGEGAPHVSTLGPHVRGVVGEIADAVIVAQNEYMPSQPRPPPAPQPCTSQGFVPS